MMRGRAASVPGADPLRAAVSSDWPSVTGEHVATSQPAGNLRNGIETAGRNVAARPYLQPAMTRNANHA
jgi:hypothetical protein